jgi:glycogen(starch) synthase
MTEAHDARRFPMTRWLVAVTEYAGLTSYTGGIGRHYAALLPALVRLGVEVDLVVFSDGERLPDADLKGVRLLEFASTAGLSRLRAIPERASRLRRHYLRGHYDRVFLPEWAALGCALPRTAPLLTNLATSMRLANEVAGIRTEDFPPDARTVVTLQGHVETRQITRSAGLIAISTAMLAWTERTFTHLPPARVVRNCVDVERVAAVSRTAALPSGWPQGDGPVILFLGRLERRKGVVDAAQAFGRLAARFPGARLVLAGASGDSRFEPDRAELLGYIPEAAHNRITWLGHVAGDELFSGIHRAAVTITPSRWEGFGNVALEAKAIGAALVCTTGSGFDDFCADDRDCLMVPPADPDALADAIGRLLTDPGLADRLGQAAAASVATFAPDPVAADLIAAADEMLGLADSVGTLGSGAPLGAPLGCVRSVDTAGS